MTLKTPRGRKSPSVHTVDRYGDPYIRVSRCDKDQVLDLAAAHLMDCVEWFGGPDDLDGLHVFEQGWYRCSPWPGGGPGAEYDYSVDRARQGDRGAFYAWMVRA